MALKGPKPKPNGVLTAFQKRTLKPVGAGPNKRTPVSYNDPYFNDGGKQVVFIVQNIVEKARRNGIDIYKVVWKRLEARVSSSRTSSSSTMWSRKPPRNKPRSLASRGWQRASSRVPGSLAHGQAVPGCPRLVCWCGEAILSRGPLP
jgi:hypothetical protein